MRVLISIEHPAWVHQFRYIIKKLNRDGNKVIVLAIDKDGTLDLLNTYNIQYIKVANGTGNNIFEKLYLFITLSIKYAFICFKYKSDILIGRASPMMSVAAFVNNKKQIIFEDTDLAKYSVKFCSVFAEKVITPVNFPINLGKKHVLLNTYKELFYLHPDSFTPDKQKLTKHGINPDEPYYILRFVSHKASHDFGQAGFSDEEKLRLVKLLLPKGKIYISSEAKLPQELEQYRLNLPYEDIHHLIYYAQLLMGDSATMASEAAVLGTHAVYRFSKLSATIKEQEEKYDLVRFLKVPEVSSDVTIRTVEELVTKPGLYDQGKLKREKLLKEKKNINDYFLKEIEHSILI